MMGADLYIKSIYDAHRAKHEKVFQAAVERRDAALALRVKLKRTLTEELSRGARARVKTQLAQANREVKATQARVDRAFDGMYEQGYFRDNYNATSLLWLLELSWWGDVGKGYVSAEGRMSVTRAKAFLAVLEKTPVPDETTVGAKIKAMRGVIDTGQNSPEAWHKMFVAKRKRLIEFLQTAIALKEPIICSL